MKSSVILVASVLLFACGGAASVPAAPAATPASAPARAPASGDLKAPGEAKVGDRTRCPVSGEEFTVKDDSPHTDYQGKTYYFCCPHCVQKFESDPAKYVGKPST